MATDMTRFEAYVRQKELNPAVANQLVQILPRCEVVVLCDDSDSMSCPIAEEGVDPFAPKRSTRWLELKKFCAAMIEMVTAVHPRGVDVHFLNRPPVRGVTQMSGLQGVFGTPPAGPTPLADAIRRVLAEKADAARRGPVLLVVVTDGEPTSTSSSDPRTELKSVLLSKHSNVHVSFAECTDQEEDMEYLDLWDGLIPNFDNTEDYREELQRVKMVQGQQFKFDYTDYVVKVVLATFVRWYFNLDQTKNASALTPTVNVYTAQPAPQQPYSAPPQQQQPYVQPQAAPLGVPLQYAQPPQQQYAQPPPQQQQQQYGQYPQPAPMAPVVKSKFDQLVTRHELRADVAGDLQRVLSTTEIVLICDDSGSMGTSIVEPDTGRQTTRWLELKKLAAIMIEFTTAINPNGIDIYFLNRGKYPNIRSQDGLYELFSSPPSGGTPLAGTIEAVYADKAALSRQQPLLVVAITDGEPSDTLRPQYNTRHQQLREIIKQKGPNVHVSFAECTDNAENMDYLDGWDRKISNFDNTDDYREELARVKRVNGPNFKFDYNDYVVKILLATFCPKYFKMDQQSTCCMC